MAADVGTGSKVGRGFDPRQPLPASAAARQTLLAKVPAVRATKTNTGQILLPKNNPLGAPGA
jgi:hypothetical protein